MLIVAAILCILLNLACVWYGNYESDVDAMVHIVLAIVLLIMVKRRLIGKRGDAKKG